MEFDHQTIEQSIKQFQEERDEMNKKMQELQIANATLEEQVKIKDEKIETLTYDKDQAVMNL